LNCCAAPRHVILRQQVQLQGSITEANVALSSKPLNLVNVLLTYSALLDEYRPIARL